MRADSQSELSEEKSNFGILELRVVHAEEDVREIKEEFRTISAQLKELRSIVLERRTPYASIASILGAMVIISGAIWGMAIDPIRSDINSIKNKLEQIVPREIHVEKWAEEDKEFARLSSAIGVLQKDKLDKIDVENLRAQLAAKIDELNSRLKRH